MLGDLINVEHALLWIVLLPFAGAIINGLVGRHAEKRLVGTVAVGSVAIAFLLGLNSFVHLVGMPLGEDAVESPRLVYDFYEWFSIAIGSTDVPVRVAFVMDPLSGVMTLIVTGVGLLIHIYSLGYMADDDGYARFFTYMNLFMGCMLVLVLASSMPVMFVGWEGVGLCSYLLIGFWYKNGEYAVAGRKAFIYNRVGDFGVLIGMFLLVTSTRSFEFAEIADRSGSLLGPLWLGRTELGVSVATVACLFLFLGCTGKSAQIPLFTWLPDAMAGPTPVSALIHAATMVTAGVYLCCRMSDVFILSPVAMGVIMVTGALTALLAASIALVQNQAKKILAYSTVSQLGFMFAAVGAGAFAAGVFHLFTHAFFKACLFLGAGAIMHAVHAHGDADIRKLGGLHRRLPVVHWTFLAACAAIAGVPFTSGFFSKDEILLGALSSPEYFGETWGWIGTAVFGVLVVAATLTAFYMSRLYFVAFGGDYRSAEGASHEHHGADDHPYDPYPRRPGRAIAVPLIILGAGSLLVGYVGLPLGMPNLLGGWLHGTLAALDAGDGHGGPNAVVAIVSGMIAMGVGGYTAYLYYSKHHGKPARRLAAQVPGLYRALLDKWRVDELYDFLVIRRVRWLAYAAGKVDNHFVDMLIAKATALGVRLTGWALTRLQSGVVYAYATAMVVGIAAIAWWFVVPHPQVDAVPDRDSVRWMAGRGLGYEYRWDLDSDGQWDCPEREASEEEDCPWSPERFDVTARYTPEDYVGYALIVEGGRPGSDEEIPLDAGEEHIVGATLLGRLWQRDPEGGDRLPTLRLDDGKIHLRVNDARVRTRTGPAEADDEVTLGAGDVFQVGTVTFRIAAVVRATLEIKNSLNNVRSATFEATIRPPPQPARQAALDTVGGAP